jgi:hypothetical protein
VLAASRKETRRFWALFTNCYFDSYVSARFWRTVWLKGPLVSRVRLSLAVSTEQAEAARSWGVALPLNEERLARRSRVPKIS